MSRTGDDQLTNYLTAVHSIEVQALAQLEAAPDIAGDPGLAGEFSRHLEETREQERSRFAVGLRAHVLHLGGVPL